MGASHSADESFLAAVLFLAGFEGSLACPGSRGSPEISKIKKISWPHGAQCTEGGLVLDLLDSDSTNIFCVVYCADLFLLDSAIIVFSHDVISFLGTPRAFYWICIVFVDFA